MEKLLFYGLFCIKLVVKSPKTIKLCSIDVHTFPEDQKLKLKSGTANQSTRYGHGDGYASNAIDGDTNGNYKTGYFPYHFLLTLMRYSNS